MLAGKYRLERLLGHGGMGMVYAAENTDIGRKVALKVLHAALAKDPQLVARFRQEARASAAIGHPGIVDVLDFGTTPDGAAFIVMERLEGETLGARLDRDGFLPVGDAVVLMDQVLDALAAAHAKGIVHRDLKPDNVFLVERPARAVKLLDFGISKLVTTEDVRLTRTGLVMGTPLYMSPEQARGMKQLTPTSDVYSMGAVFHHLLGGQPPFTGDSYNEVLAKVLTYPVQPLGELRPGLPPALVELCETWLAKRAESRPASAREAREALRRAAAEAGLELGGQLPPAPPVRAASAPRPQVDPLAETRVSRPDAAPPAATPPEVTPPAAAAARAPAPALAATPAAVTELPLDRPPSRRLPVLALLVVAAAAGAALLVWRARARRPAAPSSPPASPAAPTPTPTASSTLQPTPEPTREPPGAPTPEPTPEATAKIKPRGKKPDDPSPVATPSPTPSPRPSTGTGLKMDPTNPFKPDRNP